MASVSQLFSATTLLIASTLWSQWTCVHVYGACIECDSSLQCENQSIIATVTDDCASIDCYGYASCLAAHPIGIYASSDTIATTINCYGHRSCQKSSNITANLCKGNGQFSLSKASDISCDTLLCYGESSCQGLNSPIFVTNEMECSGLNACSNLDLDLDLDLVEVASIDASGMFSFQNNVIYSYLDDNDTFEVTIGGYLAGFNTTIICQSGHKCILNCYTTGCSTTNLVCEETEKNNTTCIVSCDDSNGNICPRLIENISQISAITQEYILPIGYNTNYDIFDVYESNCNDGCSNSSYICDDLNELNNCTSSSMALNNINNSNSLCCRGYKSCSKMNINIEDNTTNATIYCMAENGCDRSTITGTVASVASGARVGCGGRVGCYATKISNINRVLCHGYGGCLSSTIENVSYVGCSGQSSCFDAKLKNIEYIHLTGEKSVEYTRIDNSGLTKFYIYALAYNSIVTHSILSWITCDNSIIEECILYCYNQDACLSLDSHYITCNCTIKMLNHTQSINPTSIPSILPTVVPTESPTELETSTNASILSLINTSVALLDDNVSNYSNSSNIAATTVIVTQKDIRVITVDLTVVIVCVTISLLIMCLSIIICLHYKSKQQAIGVRTETQLAEITAKQLNSTYNNKNTNIEITKTETDPKSKNNITSANGNHTSSHSVLDNDNSDISTESSDDTEALYEVNNDTIKETPKSSKLSKKTMTGENNNSTSHQTEIGETHVN